MKLLSVAQAAKQLGVSISRVHRMVSDGVLPAQRVGSQWIIDARDVRRAERFSAGRPLSARSAWAVLLAADEPPHSEQSGAAFDALAASDRSRARRRLAELRDRLRSVLDDASISLEDAANTLAADLRALFRRRAERLLLGASPRDLPDLRDDLRLRLSGLSLRQSEIASGDIVEAYVVREHVAGLRADYMLVDHRHEPNVVLHVVDAPPPWRTGHAEQLDWLPDPQGWLVLAVDLAEHQSPREAAAAARLAAVALRP